jgi:hypothetical protein
MTIEEIAERLEDALAREFEDAFAECLLRFDASDRATFEADERRVSCVGSRTHLPPSEPSSAAPDAESSKRAEDE